MRTNRYTLSDRPGLSRKTTFPDKAFEKNPDGMELILSSGQGRKYQHKAYRRMLREKGIQWGMSRNGLDKR